jgi:hypothetical protein
MTDEFSGRITTYYTQFMCIYIYMYTHNIILKHVYISAY